MSSNVNLRAQARANAASRVCASLQVPVDTADILQRFKQTLRELPANRSVSAVARTLPEPAARALSTLTGDRFPAVGALLERAPADRFALTARDELTAAVDEAQRQIRSTTRRLLAKDVVRFALANGATAESCSGSNVSAVVIAAGDNRTGVVRILDDGPVAIEWQGLHGVECQDWTAALTSDLRAQGWDITVESEHYHGGGRGDGERLIRPAAARDSESLARGVVALAEEELRRGRAWHEDAPLWESAQATSRTFTGGAA